MNKQKILLMLGMIILFSVIIYAVPKGTFDQVDPVSNIETVPIKERHEQIIEDKIQKEISIQVTDIVCDVKWCYSQVFQDGLINTEWRIDNLNQSNGQLKQSRKDWIKNRLEQYADVTEIRLSRVK